MIIKSRNQELNFAERSVYMPKIRYATSYAISTSGPISRSLWTCPFVINVFVLSYFLRHT